MKTYDLPDDLDNIYKSHSEETGFENVLLRYKTREVLRHVKGPRVLDVGCGIGFICKEIAALGFDVVGVDGSAAKLARARTLNTAPKITYAQAMIGEWTPPFPFDTIVATNVLEHVPDAVALLQQCRKMLTPAGRMIVTVPNALGLHKRVGKALGLINDFYALTDADLSKGHRRIYDRLRLTNDLSAAGFRAILCQGILLKPLSHKQMESWDLKLVDAFYEIGKELPDYCSDLIAISEHGTSAS